MLHVKMMRVRWISSLAMLAACGFPQPAPVVDAATGDAKHDPPTSLQYSDEGAQYPTNVAIASNVPTHGGGDVISCAVTPPIPAGLAFDSTTGVISGMPTAASPMMTYAVTATGPGGFTGTNLTIVVYDPLDLTLEGISNGSVNVSRSSDVLVTANDALVPASLSGITMKSGGAPDLQVTITLESQTTIRAHPTSAGGFTANTSFEIDYPTTLQDVFGQHLSSPFVVSFTTSP